MFMLNSQMEVSRDLEDETNLFIFVNSITNSDTEEQLGQWRAYQRETNLKWAFFKYLVLFSAFCESVPSPHLSKGEIWNKRLTYSSIYDSKLWLLMRKRIVGLNKVLYLSRRIFLVLINSWLN